MTATLDSSTPVKLAVLDYRIALAELEASSVDFDIHPSIAPFLRSRVTLSNSFTEDFSVTDRSSGLSLGLKTKLLFGTELEGSFQSIGTRSGASTSLFPSYHQSAFLLKLTQPLLRGAGPKANMVRPRKALAKAQRYYWALLETANGELETALSELAEVVAARARVRVQEALLKNAEQIHEANLALQEAGRKSPIEALQSEARVESVRAKLALTRSGLEDALERLSSVAPSLGLDTADSSEAEFNLGSLPLTVQEQEEWVPRLREIQSEIEENEAELEKAVNGRLPKLDLGFEYLSSGLSQSQSASLGDALRFHAPSWELSLSFSWSIGGNEEYGTYLRHKVGRDRKELDLENEKKAVELEERQLRETAAGSALLLESLRNRESKQRQQADGKAELYRAGRISLLEYFDSEDELGKLLLSEIEQQLEIEHRKIRSEVLRNQVGGAIKDRFLATLPQVPAR